MSTTRIVAAVFVAALGCVGHAEAQTEGRPCEQEPTDEVIAYGDVVTCAIGLLGDSDLFRFQGFAGEIVSVRVTDQSGPNGAISCVLELLRPNTTLLGSAIHANMCEVRTTLDTSGQFTVRVTENGNDNLMNYAVELTRLRPVSPTAMSINPGNTFTNRIDPYGDADLFVFSGVSGDVISLRVTDRQAPMGPSAPFSSCLAQTPHSLHPTFMQARQSFRRP